jgi:hypothetical protein
MRTYPSDPTKTGRPPRGPFRFPSPRSAPRPCPPFRETPTMSPRNISNPTRWITVRDNTAGRNRLPHWAQRCRAPSWPGWHRPGPLNPPGKPRIPQKSRAPSCPEPVRRPGRPPPSAGNHRHRRPATHPSHPATNVNPKPESPANGHHHQPQSPGTSDSEAISVKCPILASFRCGAPRSQAQHPLEAQGGQRFPHSVPGHPSIVSTRPSSVFRPATRGCLAIAGSRGPGIVHHRQRSLP